MRHSRESIEVPVDIFWHDDDGPPVILGVHVDVESLKEREDILDVLDAILEQDKIERAYDHAEMLIRGQQECRPL